jgi:hypothetical protein
VVVGQEPLLYRIGRLRREVLQQGDQETSSQRNRRQLDPANYTATEIMLPGC